jgi:hypothetical protein
MNDYLQGLARRLTADGCTVTQETLGERPILIGYQAQWKALTRMHVFVVAAEAGFVDEAALREFTDAVVTMAAERKGRWRGLQSGVIALPVLVGTGVDAEAAAITQKSYRLNMGGFAMLAQPAVVDVTAHEVHTFRGTRLWGYAFNSLIRQKYETYLV